MQSAQLVVVLDQPEKVRLSIWGTQLRRFKEALQQKPGASAEQLEEWSKRLKNGQSESAYNTRRDGLEWPCTKSQPFGLELQKSSRPEGLAVNSHARERVDFGQQLD